MVAMTQQQKALLSRMQGIESLLEDLGLKGGQDLDELRQKKAAAARMREQLLEERLNRLDQTTTDLAGNLASLADQLGRFLGLRDNAAQDWANGGAADALATAAQLAAETAASARQAPEAAPAAGPERPAAKVISLHAASGDKQPAAFAAGRTGAPAAGFADPPQAEPPRHAPASGRESRIARRPPRPPRRARERGGDANSPSSLGRPARQAGEWVVCSLARPAPRPAIPGMAG